MNSSSLDHPLVILPDQGLEIVAIAKKIMMGCVGRSAYLARPRPDRDGRGGLRSDDQVTHYMAACNAQQPCVTV